jgi:hypothetical protein
VARWYDPSIAHFVQADSEAPQLGQSQTFDRYMYVNDNPIRYNDPTGHMLDTREDGGWWYSASGTSGSVIGATGRVSAGTSTPTSTPTATPTPTLNWGFHYYGYGSGATGTPTPYRPPVSIKSGPTTTPTVTPSLTPAPINYAGIGNVLEGVSVGFDIADKMNWYHLPALPGLIIDASSQCFKDYGKYDFLQIAARASLVAGEGQLISGVSGFAGTISGLSCLETGPWTTVAAGLLVYGLSNKLGSDLVDKWNENTWFPLIDQRIP